jgi:toxin ParE1/3/4
VVQVSWTPDALRDLRFLQDYIGRDSTQAALAVARRIRADVKRLESFPESGRLVPEFGPPYREVIVGSYRVIYRFRPERNRVRILGVIHGSRMLPPLPEDA